MVRAAAQAEISRAQLWQWMRYGAKLDEGRAIAPALYNQLLPQVMARIEEEVGPERFARGHYREAVELFTKMTKSEDFVEFLTLPA
jgi:malate synthase